MTDYNTLDVMLLVAGVTLPIAAVFYVFLNRSRPYPAWVKLAATILCFAGLAWGAVDWILLHWQSFHLTRDVYDMLHGTRGLLGGFCIGIALAESARRRRGQI
jgi:hypothetical protein